MKHLEKITIPCSKDFFKDPVKQCHSSTSRSISFQLFNLFNFHE